MKKAVSIVAAMLLLVVCVGVPRGTVTAAIDPGLELHWNLDEGSGAVANDDSGHGNVGTIFNGSTFVLGHSGLALSLNGVDQYAQTDTPLASLGTVDQPYALSAWVNIPNGVTAGNIVHISSNADGSGWCIPFLRLQNGFFTATGWDQNGEVSAVGTTPVGANQWYQVLTSWDPVNGLRLFVNGTLEASTPQADYSAAGTPIYASIGLGNGACSEDQGYLQGIVDDVRIYSRALTPTDITTISTEGDPVLPSTNNAVQSAAATPKLTDTGIETALIGGAAACILVAAIYVRVSRAPKNNR